MDTTEIDSLIESIISQLNDAKNNHGTIIDDAELIKFLREMDGDIGDFIEE
jgi:predicted AlkP superfamily pyrophosphatase or phosphodiesterase